VGARRIALALGLAGALAIATPVAAEGPFGAKLFVVSPSEVGAGWTAQREDDQGDLYQAVYAAPRREGEGPMASLTIGLTDDDEQMEAALDGSRRLYERNGYRFEATSELGDRPGWRGTFARPGVSGTIYVFAVGRAIVYAAVLGPAGQAAQLDETAASLAQAQERRLPR
jgi:hypothetical protein